MNNTPEIKVVVICGVSGSGKNTLIARLLKDPQYNFIRVVSYTSRPNYRSFENNGTEYHFVTKDEFRKMIQDNLILEYSYQRGHYFGTPKNGFSKSGLYLSIVDIRDAPKIKLSFPDTLIIFIDVPKQQIIKRLEDRGETKQQIKVRLNKAEKELASIKNADLVIDNLDNQIDTAYANLKKAIDNFLSIS